MRTSTTVHLAGREEHVLRFDKDERAEADALLLAYARQAVSLGISDVNLLVEALNAETDVRAFERRSGQSLDWGRFTLVGDLARMTPDDWKALDVLVDILRGVPNALGCWRVRYALSWLRAKRHLRDEKDLPPELKKLLRRVGDAVADPKKPGAHVRERRAAPRRGAILTTWQYRDLLAPDARATRAEALGFADWDSLKRQALRYLGDKRG